LCIQPDLFILLRLQTKRKNETRLGISRFSNFM
jgi:hypothetical protein